MSVEMQNEALKMGACSRYVLGEGIANNKDFEHWTAHQEGGDRNVVIGTDLGQGVVPLRPTGTR
jgi:hypothetical protein